MRLCHILRYIYFTPPFSTKEFYTIWSYDEWRNERENTASFLRQHNFTPPFKTPFAKSESARAENTSVPCVPILHPMFRHFIPGWGSFRTEEKSFSCQITRDNKLCWITRFLLLPIFFALVHQSTDWLADSYRAHSHTAATVCVYFLCTGVWHKQNTNKFECVGVNVQDVMQQVLVFYV